MVHTVVAGFGNVNSGHHTKTSSRSSFSALSTLKNARMGGGSESVFSSVVYVLEGLATLVNNMIAVQPERRNFMDEEHAINRSWVHKPQL